MVEENIIFINSDFTIENTSNIKVNNIEEHQILDTLHNLGRTNYTTLVKQLSSKPIFGNIANSLDAFSKYFTKSAVFGKLFYINFGILATIYLLGVARCVTGLLRDKPVTQIFIILFILTGLIFLYLWRLTSLVCRRTIPALYKTDILPKMQTDNNWQWKYFLLGYTALTASFMPLVNLINKNDGSSGNCGTSSDSSCGSSCSSCGGCGGGD